MLLGPAGLCLINKVSQKNPVVVCLLFCSLVAHGAETLAERRERLIIRPLYPTLTRPPSTRIQDGLWKEEAEYGIVRYTRGEKLTNAKDGGLVVNPGAPEPSSQTKTSTTTWWRRALSPGSLMSWRRTEKTSADISLIKRPAPNGSIRGGPGDPESLGPVPALPPREKATTGFDYAALRARAAPDMSLHGRVKADAQQLPEPPPIPRHVTTQEPYNGEKIDDRFTSHSLPDLIDLLKNGSSPRFRARIADELGRRGPEAANAVPALISAFGDPSSLVKASAALAVGNIGGDTSELQPLLALLLQDKNLDVKISAKTALSRLGNRPVQLAEQRAGRGR